MSRIFISHSSANDHQALALREWLAEEGWSSDSDVYLDIHPDSGMAAGERWLNALHMTRSQAFSHGGHFQRSHYILLTLLGARLQQ